MAQLDYLPAGPHPYVTHRAESWRVELLDENDGPLGLLQGVQRGSIDRKVHNLISGGGDLVVHDRGQDIDWAKARVQPWWTVEGVEPWPLGVYLASAPVEGHTASGVKVWTVELLDKLVVLEQDKVDGSYSLAAGTVVTDAVEAVIESAGETHHAITASTETLAAGQVWPAGTPKLRIINDLLASINYFSLRANGFGQYVSEPWRDPKYRARAWDFRDGQAAIHLPDFTVDADFASIPNKVVQLSIATGDEEALVGVALNTDPTSPFSYQARGNRWIVDTPLPVEATSQTVVTAQALRSLYAQAQRQARLQLEHMALPLQLNDVVGLEVDDVSGLAVVQSTRVTFQRRAPSLMQTVAEKVVL